MIKNVPFVSVASLLCFTAPCIAASPPEVDSITVLAVADLAETYCPESHGIYQKTRGALEAAGVLPDDPEQRDGDPSGRNVPGLDARVRALKIEVDQMGRKAFCDMMRRQGR